MDCRGKVAVVAGGASGLGRAVCEDLAENGARIAILDRDHHRARELSQAIPGSLALGVDVTDAESAHAAIDDVLTRFGAVHFNINTAGVIAGAKIVSDGEPASLAEFQKVIEVNLIGTFNMMRLTVAAMMRNEPDDGERGVVINTSSGAAFDGQTGQAAYSASKAGLIGLALPVARDLAGTGIRVNTIAPGLFETPMATGLPDKVRQGLLRSIPEPSRLGRPAEFARLVRHIVDNAYLNAEWIRLDAATRLNIR